MKNIQQAALNAAQKNQAAHIAAKANRKKIEITSHVGETRTVFHNGTVVEYHNCNPIHNLCGHGVTNVTISGLRPAIRVMVGKVLKWIKV